MIIPGSGALLSGIAFTVGAITGIVGAGSGYTAGDIVEIQDEVLPIPGIKAKFVVDTVGPSGEVLTVTLKDQGVYKKIPSGPIAGGTGSGLDLDLNWKIVALGAYPSPVLSFTVQPTDEEYNTSINPAIKVSAVGNLGTPVTDYAGQITLSIGTNPGSPAGTLSGTTTQTAVAGVATFSDIQIDQKGAGYTLVASAPLLTDITSATFNIGKATGGTITTSGAYTIHTFTTSGTFTTLVNNLDVDYLIVGGGGGAWQGGGGAGGLSYVTGHNIASAGPIIVTIGAGSEFNGAGAANGGATTFVTTVVGGGRGGGNGIGESGAAGSCGGGGGWPAAGGTSTGGAGSVGFAGGGGKTDINDLVTGGGGGGGMGTVGGDAVELTSSGNGGDGVQNSISGAAVWYCGGGAGDVSGGTYGTAGQGRDGPGGGGSRKVGPDLDAQDGIVIVRYLT